MEERFETQLLATNLAPSAGRSPMPGVESSAPLRVMSFNVRFGTAPDGPNRWELRHDRKGRITGDRTRDQDGFSLCHDEDRFARALVHAEGRRRIGRWRGRRKVGRARAERQKYGCRAQKAHSQTQRSGGHGVMLRKHTSRLNVYLFETERQHKGGLIGWRL